jgi:hypothetical protein
VDCSQAVGSFRYPALRIEAREHIRACASCSVAVGPEIVHDHNQVVEAADRFVRAGARFDEYVESVCSRLGHPERVDASRRIAQVMVRQVHSEFETYFMALPDDNVAALCWLQKAFVLCRIFGSEAFFDHTLPFEKRKKRLDVMPAPPQRAISEPMTIGEATSLSHTPSSPEDFGYVVFNDELQLRIDAELAARKFVHALTLVCDSPKHGVLSPLLNLAATASPEWIYHLGLIAMTQAIDAFRMDAENPTSEL